MLCSIVSFIIVISTTAFLASMVILCAFLKWPGDRLYAVFAVTWAKILIRVGGVRIRVDGEDNLDPGRPVVFMTNHRSHYDTPILVRTIPFRLYFIAKMELRKIPFLGKGMESIDMIFIDRGDRAKSIQSMKNAARLIAGGRSVVMFPEGTRLVGKAALLPFKKGGFHLARNAGVRIQPVVIIGSEKILPKGSLAIKPGEVIVRFGTPIEADPDRSVEELLEKTRGEMMRLVES